MNENYDGLDQPQYSSPNGSGDPTSNPENTQNSDSNVDMTQHYDMNQEMNNFETSYANPNTGNSTDNNYDPNTAYDPNAAYNANAYVGQDIGYNQTTDSTQNTYQNQQMNATNPYYNQYNTQNFSSESPVSVPKKKSKKWLWALSILPIAALACVLCFFFIPGFKNFVYKNVFGTTKYYQHIEASCDEEIEKVTSNLLSSVKTSTIKNPTIKGSCSITLNDELKNQMGFDLSELKIDYSATTVDNSKIEAIYTLKHEDTSLLDVNMYANLEEKTVYLKIPSLSEQYIDFSSAVFSSDLSDTAGFASGILNSSTTSTMSTAANQILQKLANEVDTKEVEDILNDYIEFIFNELSTSGSVSLKDKVEYKVSNSSTTCDQFTVSLTQKQIANVIINLLNKLKSDQRIIDLVDKVAGSSISTFYTAGVESLITTFKEEGLATATDDPFMNMNVYTNGTTIFGRSFVLTNSDSDTITLEYGVLSDKNGSSALLQISSSDDSASKAGLTIDSKKENGASNGTICFFSDEDTYKIEFSNLKINEDQTINGTFSMTVESTASLDISFSGENQAQAVSLCIKENGADYMTLNYTFKEEEAKDYQYPEITTSNSFAYDDSEAFKNYLTSSKLEEVVQKFMDEFNLPTTYSANEYASLIISSLCDTPTYDYGDSEYDSNTYGESNDAEISADYSDPTQFGLPEGTTISESGFYHYELTENDLEVLKQKGKFYPSFKKTLKETENSFKQIAQSLSPNAEVEFSHTVSNELSGSLVTNYQIYDHYFYDRWDVSDGSNVTVYSDTLNNEIYEVSITGLNADNTINAMLSAMKTLGLTTIDETTLSTMKKDIEKEDGFESYEIGDYSLSVSNFSYNDTTEYTISIRDKDLDL